MIYYLHTNHVGACRTYGFSSSWKTRQFLISILIMKLSRDARTVPREAHTALSIYPVLTISFEPTFGFMLLFGQHQIQIVEF